MRHSKETNDFVKTNYSLLGLQGCAGALKLTKSQIESIKNKLGLKMDTSARIATMRGIRKKIKAPDLQDVNSKIFCSIASPEIAYILGLIWADGYIKYSPEVGKSNMVELISTYPDANEFINVFNSIGKWKIYTDNVKDNRKVRCTIRTSNVEIAKFLFENNYADRSKGACKILNLIPNHLKHYWFLGLWDGDGGFYINKRTGHYKSSICSCLNQDWLFVEHFLIENTIPFKIEKTTTKAGSYSKIHISGKYNVKKLGEILYHKKLPTLGLRRKFLKFLEIKALC